MSRRTANQRKLDSARQRARLARDAAISELQHSLGTLVISLRRLFTNRSTRCRPGCRGWYIDSDGAGELGVEVQFCRPCAADNGYTAFVTEEIVALLPEAQRALMAELRNK